MIKIFKDGKIASVPAGSLKQFLSAGWEPTEDHKEISESPSSIPEEKPVEVLDEENTESQDDSDDDVIYVDPEELAQKPLGELDKEELVILAEYKGLDVSELKTIKQLKAALRSLE